MLKPEIIFQAQRFSVERVLQVAADGSKYVREIVRHPGAAVILPLLDDGRVVFIRNYRAAVNETLIELPAGTLDRSEDPLSTAKRELAEETGYRAGNMKLLLTFCMSPGILDEKMHLFLATALTAGQWPWSRAKISNRFPAPGMNRLRWSAAAKSATPKPWWDCFTTNGSNDEMPGNSRIRNLRHEAGLQCIHYLKPRQIPTGVRLPGMVGWSVAYWQRSPANTRLTRILKAGYLETKIQPFRVLPFLGWASSELHRLQRNCCELSFPPHLLQRRSFNFLANFVRGRSPHNYHSSKSIFLICLQVKHIFIIYLEPPN